ncbi:MAG: hypothetical protein WCB98_03130 [Candidatus Aquirickettsiella gammari]
MFIDYVPQLICQFESLLGLLEQLNSHIRFDLAEFPLWIDDGADGFAPNRDKVIYALGNFGPSEALSPQETFKCPGVVAGTLETLDLIGEVNAAKDAFKALLAACHQVMNQDICQWVRDTLKYAGYPAIKLKQVLRHIPFIRYHPRRVAWTKGKHTASKLLSRQDSEQMLIKAGQGLHIDLQRIKLKGLDAQVKLVKHRQIKPGWVVNIGSFKQNKRSQYEDIRTALPLFYLHQPQLPAPIVCFGQQRAKKRKLRADKQIESLPFLPSISVYRYKTMID